MLRLESQMIAKRHILYALSLSTVGIIALLIVIMLLSISTNSEENKQRHSLVGVKQQQKTAVHLYFSDNENQFLTAEARILMHSADPAHFAKNIVEALIKGPQQGLVRTIPVDTAIRAIYVTQEGICYVDLTSDIAEKHPGGIKSELLTIYSIVNSLILNVFEIEAVKMLIDGNESPTLAGHIDLQSPVKANMLLIR
jgi:spore germination protein GerM